MTDASAAPLKEYFPHPHLYFTGSGSSAIFLYLRARAIVGKRILCPSNICYSVVFAIIESGNAPLFCDIDATSGNITLEDILWVSEGRDDIGAIILPYMYGNAVDRLPEIIAYCRHKGMAVIEDLAAALGSEYEAYRPGTLGDAAIYSFGRNKHIDMRYGGLLGINTRERVSLAALPPFSEQTDARQAGFERAYKQLLYSSEYERELPSLQDAARKAASSYLGTFTPDTRYFDTLGDRLIELPSDRKHRCAVVASLDAQIRFDTISVHAYRFAAGSNPWRYNLLVNDSQLRSRIIHDLLEAAMPVSIWYPPINRLFAQPYTPKAVEFSKKILNLDISKIGQRGLDTFLAIINSHLEVKR